MRARRVRRGALVAACVAAVLGGAFAISRTGPSNELTCRTGADRVAQTWSPVIAMQIHSAILGVAPYAQVSLVHAISRVDAYAARWRDAWDGICHAEMSEATRDLRAGCLEQRLGSLASASQVLRTPDRTTASHVLDVAFALPDLEICDDVATLHKVVSVPPEIAGRVRALENDIALGEMMVRAGKFGEASERLDRTRAEVESIGHIATLAHTELALALLGSQQRHNTDAKAYAEAALNHSIQANDDVALARSYLALAGAALANGDAVRSKELAATADVAVRRVGDPPRLRANLIVLDALQPAVAGDFAEGVRRIPRAIATLDASRQSDRLATLYRTLGSLLLAFARFDEAARAYDQEVALDRELYGPNHPLTAESLGVRAKFHLHREEYKAAEADLEEQYRILRDALGEDHLLTLSASADTATIDQLYGRYDAAIDKLRRAADAFERDGGPRQAGTARRYLAEALVAAGRIGAAEREILRARAFEKEGDAVALLPYDVVIAYIRERQGRLDEARTLIDRAERQVVKLLGPDNPVLNDVWLLRARIAIDERHMQQALPLLARITSGSVLADAKTLLVAVRAAMGDRAGARRAAADARGILDRIGPNARPELRAKLLR